MLSSTTATTMKEIHPKRRHRLARAQLNKLEATFNKHGGYIDFADIDALAQELDLDEAYVRKWFYNRRARAKRKDGSMLSSTSATTTMVNLPPKRRTHDFTKAQRHKLQAIFNKYSGFIDVATKDDLAREFDEDEALIRRWFRNRRAQAKLKNKMLSSTTATTTENIHPKRRGRPFTRAQRNILEASFNKNNGYIGRADKHDLAQELDLDEASVKAWFESRRAKVRRQIKPTTSEIRDAVAQTPAMETTSAKQSTGNRQLFDLSKLQPEQSIINTGRCFGLRKEVQNQQSGLPSKQSHTTEIGKPEADSLSSVAASLDGRSENTCKDVNFTGLLGTPKASNTGIADKQVSSPLMVYNKQKFSPTAVPRVLPVNENPRDHYDGRHVMKIGTPHLPHERPSTKLRGIVPKSAVSSSPSERQGQGHPQDGDECSNAPSSNEQLRSHSENSGKCPRHVPMSTQLPSKSVMDRTQETVVPDKDTLVHEGLPGEITFDTKEHDSSFTNYSQQEESSVDIDEPKEHDHLNNYYRQELSSVERSLDTDGPNIQHPALDKVSFFSAMCEIDTDWTPLPDDVAVMFNSYRESPDCSGGVDITDAAESEATVVEKNVHLPILLC